MTGRLSVAGVHNLYFYLSHAHDVVDTPDDLDFWVGEFCRDLSDAVRAKVRARPSDKIGIYRPCETTRAGPGDHTALPSASVLVALLTPAYLKDRQASAELEAFQATDPNGNGDRIVWVLWEQWVNPNDAPDLNHIDVVVPPAEVSASGVLELSRQIRFTIAYRQVLDEVANRVVRLAQPINGRMPRLRGATPALQLSLPRTRFVLIEVAERGNSDVLRLADRLADLLERRRYCDVVRIRYPPVPVEPVPSPYGVHLLDAGLLADVSDPLREYLLGLPDDRLVVVYAPPPADLQIDPVLRARAQLVGNHSLRPQIQGSPDRFAAAVGEIDSLIHGSSSARRPGTRPFPARTRVRD